MTLPQTWSAKKNKSTSQSSHRTANSSLLVRIKCNRHRDILCTIQWEKLDSHTCLLWESWRESIDSQILVEFAALSHLNKHTKCYIATSLQGYIFLMQLFALQRCIKNGFGPEWCTLMFSYTMRKYSHYPESYIYFTIILSQCAEAVWTLPKVTVWWDEIMYTYHIMCTLHQCTVVGLTGVVIDSSRPAPVCPQQMESGHFHWFYFAFKLL